MSWLVANTVVAAAMALLALLAARCKAAPSVVHTLWVFVLLKLVTPPLFEVPIDVSWWSAPRAAAPVVVPLHLDDAAFVLPPGVVLDRLRDTSAPVAAPVAAPVVAPVVAVEPDAWPRAAAAASALWAAGAAAMLVWFGVGLWRGHRRLRALGPVPPSLRREIEALAARLGVRVPPLRDDPAAGSPYVWSLGGACLVVPVRVLAAANAKGRAAVLAHELAHLRRGDHWLAHGELLLAAALWWHPLFWFARARMRLWAELACDAWAVASVPDATIEYATVLVQSVASPDSAVPAPAVLAARPAARAAFERRLTMILNENVACRASRAWWLPLSSLALGLVTMPVAAQRPPQDPAKLEIRVNGKAVDQLSAAERKLLLQKLLAAEEKAEARVEPVDEKMDLPDPPKPAKKKARAKVVEADPTIEARVVPHADHTPRVEVLDHPPSAKELHEMIRAGLGEARLEVLDDADLRELGITDHVVKLLDDLQAGKGLGENLDIVVKGAMKGAGKMAKKEIANDKDLRDLGIADDIQKLVDAVLENARTQELICAAAHSAVQRALKDGNHGMHGNELSLDFTIDTSDLVDSLLQGKGDFNVKLQDLIEKATHGAMLKVDVGNESQDEPADEPPPPPKKKKAKAAKKANLELR